jgi:hypothetical protein
MWAAICDDPPNRGLLPRLPDPGANHHKNLVLRGVRLVSRVVRALKSLIEKTVPAGERRHEALAPMATLEKPPYVQSEISARAWADVRKSSPSLQLYHLG